MKKIVMFLVLSCGIVGNSWAVCELTESTDLTPSDEDLYPQDPNVSRMALICEKGKCEDGEIVLAKKGHYRKNTLIDEGEFYECKLGVNDRWEPFDFKSEFPVCNDISHKEIVSTDTRDVSYGTKVADNLYVDLCRREYDEKCGVKCTPENEDKNFYCDNAVINCFGGTFGEYASFFGTCEYSDPQTRIDNYIIENEWFDKMSFWGAYVLHDGEVVNSDMNVCQGCKSGLFYGRDGYCYSNLDQAWCYWRKNKENKNTEWKDDHCECLDSGMEWDTEKHDCVKKTGSGKTGSGKTGGGKTSGKTGSSGGKTGSGKQSGKSGKTGGGTTSDTKCGVKCNDANLGSIIYCDNKLYVCFQEDASIDLFQWSFDYVSSVKRCEYSDPLTRVVGKYQKQIFVDSEYAVFGSRMLNNNEFVRWESEDFKNFCLGCANGYYATNSGWGCLADLDEAWCHFDNGVDAFYTKWNKETKLCECTDDGLVWDNTKHTCVPDNGAGGDQQPQDGKIDCSFNLGATVKCRDGVQYNKNVSVSVSSATCDTYKSNVAKYLNEIAGLLCEKSGGVGNIITDAQVKAATDNINRFFEYAKSNANVWKNSEGKFNTARLASDATAGVILGTVGGIVSAKIIKKKQVEKGFNALNCTVGGQKVADWGDEFTIGFGR